MSTHGDNKPVPALTTLPMIETNTDTAAEQVMRLCKVIGMGLDEAKAQGNRAADLIGLYRRVYDAHEILEDAMKLLTALKEKLGKGLLPEAFERENTQTLTTAEKDRVTINQLIWASIPADKRTDAFRWLRANGHGDLVQETVNAGSLSAFVRAEVEAMRPVSELINQSVVASASLTRGKKPKLPRDKGGGA